MSQRKTALNELQKQAFQWPVLNQLKILPGEGAYSWIDRNRTARSRRKAYVASRKKKKPDQMDLFFLLKLILTLVVLYVVQRKVWWWIYIVYSCHQVRSIGKYKAYPPTVKSIWVPFLGHMFGFGKDPVAFIIGQMKEVCVNVSAQLILTKLGTEVFSFELFGTDCVFMGSDEAQSVFYASPEATLSAADAYQFMTPAFGKDVVYDCPYEKFQEQRKYVRAFGKHLTATGFSPSAWAFLLSVKWSESSTTKPPLTSMKCGRIREAWISTPTSERWSSEPPLSAYSFLRESNFFSALQGPQIRSLVHSGYAKYMSDIDNAINVLSFFYPNLPMPSFRKRNLARKKVGEMVASMSFLPNVSFLTPLFRRFEIQTWEWKASGAWFLGTFERMRSGFFSTWLTVPQSSTYADGTTITDDQIAGLTVALMLAGQHTSNITSTWLGIFLLSHPEVM